jgi:arylsulfatase A-like enzyme
MRCSSGYGAGARLFADRGFSIQTGKSPDAVALDQSGSARNRPKAARTQPHQTDRRALETTIGELLRTAGYATAHYGKWHISGGGPGEHGYDQHGGGHGNENAYQFTDPNPVDIFGTGSVRKTSWLAVKRLESRFTSSFSWNALHASENALNATKAKYERLYGNAGGGGGGAGGGGGRQIATAAITEDLADRRGSSLGGHRSARARRKHLCHLHLRQRSWRRPSPGLNGGKGSVWEGGVRVPLIVRGPGVPANSWCHSPVVGYDFLPTFAEWAGLAVRSLCRRP